MTELTYDQAVFQRNVYQSTTDRYRDERDAARNELAAARREIARLRAVNAVLMRIFGDAIDHVVPEPAPTEKETRRA